MPFATTRRRSVRTQCLLAGVVAAAAAAVLVEPALADRRGARPGQEPIGTRETPGLVATPAFKPDGRRGGGGGEGGVAGQCPPVTSTHTNASFEGGQYVLQAGFAEDEIAACSYTVSPSDFPLRIDLCEMIFGTSGATTTTTTQWSVLVWQGTPANGTLVYVYSSNGVDLPHLVMPPGTNGTNIQFGIDPSDPEQMVIQDDGSHTFSIGFRIDQHNNQTANPCLTAPPSASNAFPATDVGGLQAPTQNWLYLLNCGTFGCPPGWKSFSQLPTGCRPSGDWVMRVTWTPVFCEQTGSCCLPNGTCQVLTEANCLAQGGNYNGDGTTCTSTTCAADLCPCCFVSTGGCVTLPPATCVAAGGIAGPVGQTCTGYVCFPTGACCLPTGDCVGPVSPGECAAQGGTFQGNGTTCANVDCPEPLGAACFPNGFCLSLTAAQAAAAGATWAGPGTTCVDANANGQPDACEAASNPADVNGDGVVNAADLAIVLAAWGTSNAAADVDDNGTVGASDLSAVLAAWG